MSTISSLMISVFGNKPVIPNSDNITYYMSEIKRITSIDYLPNIVNTPSLDIATGQISQVANISFSTSDGVSTVMCSNSRIDYLYNFNEYTQSDVSIKLEQGIDVLKTIMNQSNIIANRLALNVDLIEIMTDESLFKEKIMRVQPFYEEKTIKEWSSRVNAKGVISICGNNEELNIITNYSIKNDGIINGKVFCHIDINTLPDNPDYRFKSDVVNCFVAETNNIFASIKKDLEGMMK